MHHKTNTLRLEYLLSELRDLLNDKRAHAEATLHKNPNSHIGRVLESEAKNFEEHLEWVFRRMSKINWVEPESVDKE